MSAPEPAAAARQPAVLVRAALTLYPPAWRARYGDEVRALLDDSGGGARAAASLAWHAIPAWVSPPRQLHDGSARMRSSLATTGVAWALLAGLAADLRAAGPGPALLRRARRWRSIRSSSGRTGRSTAAWWFPCWRWPSAGSRCGCRCSAPPRGAGSMAWLLTPALVPAVFLLVAFAVGHPGRAVPPADRRAVAVRAGGGPGQRRGRSLVVPGAGGARVRRRRPCRRRAGAGAAQAPPGRPGRRVGRPRRRPGGGDDEPGLRGQRGRGDRPVPLGAGVRRRTTRAGSWPSTCPRCCWPAPSRSSAPRAACARPSRPPRPDQARARTQGGARR